MSTELLLAVVYRCDNSRIRLESERHASFFVGLLARSFEWTDERDRIEEKREWSTTARARYAQTAPLLGVYSDTA